MVREYVRQDGYRIRASEKAYNLFYKKNGFVPVETVVSIKETTGTALTGPIENTSAAESIAEKTVKARKSKGKNAISKSGSGRITQEPENPESEPVGDTAGQDAAESLEGE